MREVVQFALLGFGVGGAYALLTQGIVLVYRSSGVVNLAHGAMAMVGGFAFYELYEQSAWPYLPAMLTAVLLVAALGAFVYQAVIRPLRHASPLARIVATLGVLTVLQAAATLRYKGSVFSVGGILPEGRVELFGVVVPQDRLWLLGIAALVTALVYALSRHTRVGLATSAVAENQRTAASLGWSPDLIATVNWALGGAMAALAGILIIPFTGLTVSSLTFLVIPALAVALFAGFASFPLVLLGSLALGVIQSEMTRYVQVQGLASAAPFLLIVAVLVVRGRSLPLRSHLFDRLPALGMATFRLRAVAPFAAVVIVAALVVPDNWSAAIGTSVGAAVMMLSIVVLTGYAGQLSLGQAALGGVGALLAAQLISAWGWPFELAVAAAILGTVVVGLAFALPALRARGVNLAIVTLGLGFSLQQVIFTNGKYTGGRAGIEVGPQTVFGISIDAIFEPGRYAAFAIVVLVACVWLVSNMRRGRAGRRLVAVRTNERAAASLGVNVFVAKLYAFSVAAAIAGLAGILLAFQGYSVIPGQFDAFDSITSVTLAVLGGVGYLLGPPLGATLAQGGFPGGLIASAAGEGEQWLVLIGGVALLLILVTHPNGMASTTVETARAIGRRLSRGSGAEAPPEPLPELAPRARRARDAHVAVSEVTVRFGGVVALDGVSLDVRAGEVVGLIGPNGAGKTTLIDAITGFVRPASGTIALDGVAVDRWSAHRRAQAGIARSFQSLELFDDLTVLDNLRAASDRRDLLAYLTNLVHSGNRPLPPVAVAAVHEFDLEADLHRAAEELSYGKRRLVAIARAVATEAPILLLDEPGAGLTDAETAELGRLIRRLADEWGLGVLLVEHDVSVVMNTCDRIVVLDFGKKLAEGTPEEVRADPAVVAAYLGEEAAAPEPGAEGSASDARTAAAHGPAPNGVPAAGPAPPQRPRAASRQVLIEAQRVAAGYGATPVVRGLDLRVEPGEVVALLGANGAGKTTTLLTLVGELPLQDGRVLLGGKPTRAPLHQRARNGLAFIPEERSVLMGMSTADNLRVARRDFGAALELFPELVQRVDVKAGLLSGGEQKMLSLGRALARDPSLLLADELSLGLAPLVVDRLLEAVRRAADDRGVGVLLVEQHVKKVLRYADRVYVMRRGEVVLEGRADELRDRMDLLEASYFSAAAGSDAEAR